MPSEKATRKSAKRRGADSKASVKKKPARRKAAKDETAARQAAGHSKIRRDHSSEIAEDYVEIVAQLVRAHGEARTVDISRRLGVSHVTVTKTINRLQNEGLVSSEPYRSIFLTDDGRSLAGRIELRHELVVRFLRAIGVNPDDAEADAEGIEHHVSSATLEAMKRFLAES